MRGALAFAALVLTSLVGGSCAVAPRERATSVRVEAAGPRVAPPNGAVRASGFAVDTADPGVVALDVFVEGMSSPVLGETVRNGAALEFSPRFPFEEGTRYRLRVTAGERVLTEIPWELSGPAARPTTHVSSITPGHPVVPANLLKFYVSFSAPMRRGEAYRCIALEHADGRPAEGVFLQLDPELWDPESRRLTLLLDPGRIKRGLALREEVGPTLIEGESYVLRIDAGWRDARGAPLTEAFELRFRAGPPDRESPRADQWQLTVPPSGTREPLVVAFREPLDRALLERVVQVRDAITRLAVAGDVEVVVGETVWHFTPDRPWRVGHHEVVAEAVLEDRAGNSLGRAFETGVGEADEEFVSGAAVAVLPFEIR